MHAEAAMPGRAHAGHAAAVWPLSIGFDHTAFFVIFHIQSILRCRQPRWGSFTSPCAPIVFTSYYDIIAILLGAAHGLIRDMSRNSQGQTFYMTARISAHFLSDLALISLDTLIEYDAAGSPRQFHQILRGSLKARLESLLHWAHASSTIAVSRYDDDARDNVTLGWSVAARNIACRYLSRNNYGATYVISGIFHP